MVENQTNDLYILHKELHKLQLFYALWLGNYMQINATITQTTDNSIIC